MKNFIGLIVPFIYFYIMKNEYAIFQCHHYESKKYFMSYSTKKYLYHISLMLLFAAGILAEEILFYIIVFLSVITNFMFSINRKIKLTKRVKRFFFIYFIVSYILFVFIPLDEIGSLFFYNNFIYLIILVSHSLSCVIENVILNSYIKETKSIMNGKLVIGITGSYGKTSSKNIVFDMLEKICNVSKTPKSYNTKVGIIKSIRENVDKFDDVFVCEYGVDRKGGMNKLLRVVKPNIALITEVGPQHILTFKNINNILNEKIKLAKSLKKCETAVINNDNKYLNREVDNLRCQVITYGINNDSYIMAKNINVTRNGSTFDVFVDKKKVKRLKIRLLGEHNILNTLGAIGVLLALKIDIKHIDKLVTNIMQVEHRLQLKTMDGLKVIDDSFNSNEKGFKYAIDVLNLMKEEKVVITPGVIEQGNSSNRVNFELGKYMANKVDFVVLVEKNSKSIKEGLLSNGFRKECIVEKNNFLEGWGIVKNMKDIENKIILIENDLPSIYLK